MNPNLLSDECWKELASFGIIDQAEADSKSLESINLDDLRSKPTLTILEMRKFLKKKNVRFFLQKQKSCFSQKMSLKLF